MQYKELTGNDQVNHDNSLKDIKKRCLVRLSIDIFLLLFHLLQTA